jgi:hypothetical protein
VAITDRNFNVKMAPNAKFGAEMCRLVRKLTPGGFLRADANGGCELAHALPTGAGLGVEIDEARIKS